MTGICILISIVVFCFHTDYISDKWMAEYRNKNFYRKVEDDTTSNR